MKPELDTVSIRLYCEAIIRSTERFDSACKIKDVPKVVFVGEKLLMTARAEELLKLLKE